jgi:TorA maturation chaperone TorD
MTTTTADGVRLLAQADGLLLMAEYLHHAPTDTEPRSAAGEEDLRRLTVACGLDPESDAARALIGLAAARAQTPPEIWEGERSRLFEGAALCPPNESAYIRRDKGAILADLAGFHRAFGFDHEDRVGEKQDHIVGELQFAAVLLVMLARANDSDRGEQAEITHGALRSFAEDHLGAWIDIFCERLVSTAVLPSFTLIGVALSGGWRGICDDLDLPVSDPGEFEFISESQGSPYECDGCPSQ